MLSFDYEKQLQITLEKLPSKFLINCFSAMTNQDTLREIQRGYRLEQPNYPGKDASDEKLKGLYGVSKHSFKP